jgi:hypothetical protein
LSLPGREKRFDVGVWRAIVAESAQSVHSAYSSDLTG